MELEYAASTILIIDDDVPSLKILTKHLQNLGYKTLIARSGERGLAVAARTTPDLILLDVMMPGIDGFETCRRLKALDATMDIPVIFLTALPNTSDKIKGFEAGAVDYITKPIQNQEISVRIRTHLRLRELTDNLGKKVVEQTQELLTEIAERKQAEALLRESEEKYRLLVEAANVCIFVAQDGILKLVNSKTEEISGYTAAELTAKPFLDLIHPEDQDVVMHRHLQSLQGEPLDDLYVFKVIDKKGELKWVEIKVVLIQWDGRPATLNFLSDVTEKLRAEQELLKAKKLESVGLLAGGIAHDFNNLLTGLFGNVELAKIFLSPDHKSYKYLNSALLSMENATNLTKQLLTFAKGGDPIKETLSIREVLIEMAQFSLHGSNIKLQTNIDCDLWQIEADKGQLSQVINNLIINAQQAMPMGGVIILAANNVETTQGKYVKITIQDEGEGIAPEYLEKVFDPYFSTKEKGSGLGLASTHSIIHKHNGTITVDSIPGQGTTFNIRLPVARNEAATMTNQSAPILNVSSTIQGRILIMDDEVSVQNVLGTMLKSLGHQVSFATNGEEAISLYARSLESGDVFNLAILDLTIPGGMGGQEAAKRILTLNEDAKIIVTSGYATDAVMAHYKQHGFIARIVKPYRFDELKKVIQQVLAMD